MNSLKNKLLIKILLNFFIAEEWLQHYEMRRFTCPSEILMEFQRILLFKKKIKFKTPPDKFKSKINEINPPVTKLSIYIIQAKRICL